MFQAVQYVHVNHCYSFNSKKVYSESTWYEIYSMPVYMLATLFLRGMGGVYACTSAYLLEYQEDKRLMKCYISNCNSPQFLPIVI